MKIAIVTAGGAGMFCGSCMQDNTLVRTLRLAGEDAVLVPTYTPIRVEEDDVSIDRVFMGGINVYLDSMVPGWRLLPRWLTGWLNRPGVIRWLSRFGTNTDAAKLGALTLDMLRGNDGPQRREVQDFVAYLAKEVRPDVIIFSNALLSGVLTQLRNVYHGRILCLLQGDDVFLDGLTDRWRTPVLAQLKKNCRAFDGFLTHSHYYRDHMSALLGVSPDKFRKIPLTIDTDDLTDHRSIEAARPGSRSDVTIGYFARICPEKGIRNLLRMAETVFPEYPELRLVIAGYLPKQHARWFEQQLADTQAKVPGRIQWNGSPEGRQEKFDLIRSFDLLCVPTDYEEPKGLYVLEAGLVSVPSLLPSHGAFPEIVTSLNCGTLYDPGDPDNLSAAVRQWIQNRPQATDDLPEIIRSQYGMSSTAPIVQGVIREMADSR